MPSGVFAEFFLEFQCGERLGYQTVIVYNYRIILQGRQFGITGNKFYLGDKVLFLYVREVYFCRMQSIPVSGRKGFRSAPVKVGLYGVWIAAGAVFDIVDHRIQIPGNQLRKRNVLFHDLPDA